MPVVDPSGLRKVVPVSSSKSSLLKDMPTTTSWRTAPVLKLAVRSVWLWAMKFSVSRTSPRGPPFGFHVPAG